MVLILNANSKRIVLVLGDGNLQLSTQRGLRGAQTLAMERRADPDSIALILGTQREQNAMGSIMSAVGMVADRDYFNSNYSRNTVENAQAAKTFLSSSAVPCSFDTLVIVTHSFQAHPVPGVNRVKRKFSYHLPDYNIELELMQGIYPKQRALHAAVGLVEQVVLPSGGLASNRAIGALREALRVSLDRRSSEPELQRTTQHQRN